jgi:hypothetical protein
MRSITFEKGIAVSFNKILGFVGIVILCSSLIQANVESLWDLFPAAKERKHWIESIFQISVLASEDEIVAWTARYPWIDLRGIELPSVWRKLLGVPDSATVIQTKKAYQRLMAQWSADNIGIEQQELARKVRLVLTKAYDELMRIKSHH